MRRRFLRNGCFVGCLLGGILAGTCTVAEARDFQAALSRVLADPSDPSTIFDYGAAAADAGDPTGVAAALERLLVFAPSLDNIRFELGLVYLRLGAPNLAEGYLRDALNDPSVPPQVRKRGTELLADATEAQRRWSFSGFVLLGLRHDGNANSGPNGTVQFVTDIGEVVGRLRREDTGQSDTSLNATLSGTVRYDLGSQAGHELVLPGQIYIERYNDQTQLNLAFASISPGIRFDLGRVLGRPARVTASTYFSHLTRDNETYLREAGGVVAAEIRQSDTLLWRAGLSAKAQDFRDTDDSPFNGLRDGAFYSIFAGGIHDLGPRTQVSAQLLASRKTADASFEAYNEWGLSAEIRQLLPSPEIFGSDFWEVVLLGSYSVLHYDDLDLSIDLDTAQRDKRMRIEGRVIVPVGDTASLTTRLGYYRNDSNFAIDEYDNLYVAMEFGRSF